jgi:hypothetical protein
MECFVYIDGRFWDRVSNTPAEIAKSLHAEVVSQEEFDHEVCGPSVRCELRLKEIRTPLQMTAKTVARKLQLILSRLTTNPEQGGWLVSPALKQAVQEAVSVAVTGDWARLAAILRVKSYVCGLHAVPPDDYGEPFWEDVSRHGEGERDLCSLLDSLQFIAAMAAGVIPGGMSVYGVKEGGGIKRSEAPPHSPEDPSPTIALMRECDARYAERCDHG